MPSLYETLNRGQEYRQRKNFEKIDNNVLKPYQEAISASAAEQLVQGLSGMAAGVMTAPSRVTNLLDPHRAAAARQGQVDNSDFYRVMDEINKESIAGRETRDFSQQFQNTAQAGDLTAQLIGYGVPTARLGSLSKMYEAIPGFMPKALGLAQDTLRNATIFSAADYGLSKAYGESDEVAKNNALLAGGIGALGTPIVGAAHGLIGMRGAKELPISEPSPMAHEVTPNVPTAPRQEYDAEFYQEPTMRDRAQQFAQSAQDTYAKAKENVRSYFDNEPKQNADGSFDTDFESPDRLKSALRSAYGYSQEAAEGLANTASKLKSFVKDDVLGSEMADRMFNAIKDIKDNVSAKVDETASRFKAMHEEDDAGFVRTEGSISSKFSAQREADAQIESLKRKIDMLQNDETGEAWLKELEDQNTITLERSQHFDGGEKYMDDETSVMMNRQYMDELKNMIETNHPAAQFMKDEVLKELKNQLREHRITLKGIGIEAANAVKAETRQLTKAEARMKLLKDRKKKAKVDDKKTTAAEQASSAEKQKYENRPVNRKQADGTNVYQHSLEKPYIPSEVKGLSEAGKKFRDSLDDAGKQKYDRLKEIKDNIKAARDKLPTLSKQAQGKQHYAIQEMEKEAKKLHNEIAGMRKEHVSAPIKNKPKPNAKAIEQSKYDEVARDYKESKPSGSAPKAQEPKKQAPKSQANYKDDEVLKDYKIQSGSGGGTPPPKEPIGSPKSEAPKQPKKEVSLDIDGKQYGVTLEDIADTTKNAVKQEDVSEVAKDLNGVFERAENVDINHGLPRNIKGYYDSIKDSVHVKIGSKEEKHIMLEAYMHESLHKYIAKLKGTIDFDKLGSEIDRMFTSSKHYDGKPNAEIAEEELVFYSAMKAMRDHIASLNKGSEQLLLMDKRFSKLTEFERMLDKNPELKAVADKLDTALAIGSRMKDSFLHKAMHGDSSAIGKAFNTAREADNKLASMFPKMDDTKLYDNETLNSFLHNLKSGSQMDEFHELMKQKKAMEAEATEKAGYIRDHITQLIPDPKVRQAMTHNVLRTDYHVISDLTNKKDATKAFLDMDADLRKIAGDKHGSIRESIKLLAEGMRGEIRAMNNPKFFSNAYAIAVKNGLEPTADLVSIIDRQASILAVNAKDGWSFIEKNASKPWFKEAVAMTEYKSQLGKDVMHNNPLNERKGYFAEIYDTPYVHDIDENGKITKKLDTDLTYKEGAIPIQGIRGTRGTKVFPLGENRAKWTEAEKASYAEANGFGVVLDTAGKIVKFRQHMMTEMAKAEAGRVDDFAEVMSKTVGSSVKKIALDDGVVPSIKNLIESGESKLMSSEPREGFVTISDDLAKHLPYELQETIKYVDPKFKTLLEGNIEVGYKGKDELLKLAQAVLKDTVVNFKENVVLKNPVSWVNAFMFNVSVGLQHGMSPKFMYRNMKEGIEAYSQMRDVMKKMTIGMATGKYSDAQMAKMKEVLDNNLLYQLNKEGMTMTMLSDITSHPSFSSRLTDRIAYDNIKKWFGKETADRVATVFKNIYMHPHSATGQFATNTFTKIDVMGRYALAKHKMSAEGMSAAEAAKAVNAVFGDFDTVLPKWIQYMQEFGAIPFAGWFFRVGAGIAKTAYDNPGKTIALFAGLYALQGESGKRTESWNPLATVINTPKDMVTMSPLLNLENFAVNSKVPQMHQKVYNADSPADLVSSNAI